MNKRNLITILLCISLFVPSCTRKSGTILPPEKEINTENPMTDPSIVKLFNETPVIVWIEASANFARLSSAEKMSSVLQQVVDMGAKGIIVDIKGVHGLVSYNSMIANKLTEWNGVTRPLEFDYLANIITEARKKGLKVFASMSVFAEGFGYEGKRYGKVFNDPEFAAMQSQVMAPSGETKKITDVYSYGMLNPLLPKAQEYELSLIKEVVINYAIDGFILDYCRYFDICADFSNYSLERFKEWAKLPSVKPTDIVQSWKSTGGIVTPVTVGPQFKKWIEFRAKTIYEFVAKARDAIKTIKPKMAFCSYSGAWYDSYYYLGVNWASNKYDPSVNGFSDWASPTYKNTGYAELLDMFMTGNYTPNLTGPGWWTVQGQIDGAKTILNNANIHYGSIDIGNTQWTNIKNMQDAITMILQQTKGIMLFDLVHIDNPASNPFGQSLYGSIKQAIDRGLAGKK